MATKLNCFDSGKESRCRESVSRKPYDLPAVVDCLGTSPNHGARSRPLAKLSAWPIAAVKAEAINIPTPGIDNTNAASSSAFAMATNFASNSPIRRSRSFHCTRMSLTSFNNLTPSPTPSFSSIRTSSSCSSLRRPCETMIPRCNEIVRN